MDNEVKHSLIWAVVIAIGFISIPWSISYYYSSTAQAAIAAGMEQRTLPGSQGVHWVKTDK